MPKNGRSTINMSRSDREELIDKALPRIIGRVGVLLNIQDALRELYLEWWDMENIRNLFPEEYADLEKRMREELPKKSDRMPWSLPSADPERNRR